MSATADQIASHESQAAMMAVAEAAYRYAMGDASADVGGETGKWLQAIVCAEILPREANPEAMKGVRIERDAEAFVRIYRDGKLVMP